MIIEQIQFINNLVIIQILGLLEHIKDSTRDIDAYVSYIRNTLPHGRVALFGTYDNKGQLHGYIHAEAPNGLYPELGYIVIAVHDGELNKEVKLSMLAQAEDWLRKKGATKFEMQTTRTPKTFARKWGLKMSEKRIMEKCIID